MKLEIRFGHENFGNYKRLSYKWWYALAEFIDNSTQSYFDHREEINEALRLQGERFGVVISTGDDFLRVSDNAMGMDLAELERALYVGMPPENANGRSRYGLGMKTAACWIGDVWKIITTRLGETTEFTVTVDVNEVVRGNTNPSTSERTVNEELHYTIVEVTSHHRPLRGRTIGKVKEYLRSIYRFDISSGDLLLRYNDAELAWQEFSDEDFLQRKDGSGYREGFIFEIPTEPARIVEGWVGVLRKGARSKAGFSILHRRRLIKGWPDSWRPEKVFGAGGRNDLINQRVVGELNLEDFEISHTKDEINWHGLEEELVEEGLLKVCRPYMETARKARRGQPVDHGPSDVQIDTAAKAIEEELSAPEFLEALRLEEVLPPVDQIDASNKHVVNNAMTVDPTFSVALNDMEVSVYIDAIGSPNDPYFINEDVEDARLAIVVNRQHPHWQMLEGENAVVNYLRHCVYDGVAEHRAARLNRIESDSIKRLKDSYLRVSFELLQSNEEGV